MYISNTASSCGLLFFSGLNNAPRRIIRYIKHEALPGNYTVVFSDNNRWKNGAKLAAEIKKHNLGKLVCIPNVLNPNSGNIITTWLWHMNSRAISKYLNGG